MRNLISPSSPLQTATLPAIFAAHASPRPSRLSFRAADDGFSTVGVTRSTEFRVRYAETDQMGVVYYANYLVWCEIGRTEFIRGFGTSYADLERDGILLAVTEASLRYHAAARYDDRIRVDTTLSKAGSRGLVFDYVILHAETGARLVTARTSLVSIDRDGRPTVLPATFRRTLENLA